jgi:hypothetical protein
MSSDTKEVFTSGTRLRARFFYFPRQFGIGTLERFGVKFPSGRKLLLHHFAPHREVKFHDHPWSFRTFVLWGSYVDESLEDPMGARVVTDRLRFLSTRKRHHSHTHRTSCERHTWTLVLTTPKHGEPWCDGFAPRAEHVWECEE